MKTPYLTHKRQEILALLKVTMLTPHILAYTGVSKNVRSAQKMLRNLKKAGIIESCTTKKRSRKLYYLPRTSTENHYHTIKEGFLEHDSLTAVFLCQIFRYCKNLQLQFYPPFSLSGKVCDGAVAMMQGTQTHRFLLLETDTGTHDHAEIKEKLECYLRFLDGSQDRMILFLVVGIKRVENLNVMIQELSGQYKDRVLVISPVHWNVEETMNRVLGIHPECASPDTAISDVPGS